MPTALGPFSRRACFHFSAMTSKASSQLTGSKSPSLSNLPSFLRSSGVLWRFGVDALIETGEVLGIEDEDSPLEKGAFLRTGGRLGLNIQGAEDTLLEQFGLEVSHKYLHGFIGPPNNINRFEAALSYRVPGSENYKLSISYQDGRVDDTLEDKEFWKTTLGVRF